MEEGALRRIVSPILERDTTKKALEALQSQVDNAEELHDRTIAKNPLVRAAIKIVENFLKNTGRVAYGGQAINAHLPDPLKFYDPSTTIPDYDVYTPNAEKDLRTILTMLRKAGFPEVAHREGIHEGTIKISVAYNDILDLTSMDPDIYSILYARSKTIKGIHYADANFLRSNMYKELSQPEGEIDRWEKVYTRLVLLNEAVPLESCGPDDNATQAKPIPKTLYKDIFQFIVNNKRILAGANIDKIYKKEQKNYSWLLKDTNVPIIFYSPTIDNDVIHIGSLIGVGFKTEIYEAHGDIVPGCVIIYKGSAIVAIVVEEGACYSYNRVSLQVDGGELLVASLDTVIRLFYQLSLLRDFPPISETSINCVAQNLVDLSMKIRNGAVQTKFPLFSIECSGHQPTKGSLLRAKRLRGKLRRLTRKGAASQKKKEVVGQTLPSF
jgi:hypothetical protein